MHLSDIPLQGRHNVENVLAAVATCDLLGVRPQAMRKGVKSFRPAPHRLQLVAEHEGVRYIDDSIATSPARSAVALEAMTAPVVLIAGGRDKHLPWDEFAQLAASHVRVLLLIGEAAPLIESAVRQHLEALRPNTTCLKSSAIHRCISLQDAVVQARRRAVPGDTVLLSPGCTSYDMFHDFAERGDAFIRAVEALNAA
jgi:UDP-N-acetylmuramoylalanine--D-glutamate ligase